MTWWALRSLYREGVALADAKLDRTLSLLAEERERRPVIVVATSDHGQSFGEHGLVGHLYGVHEPLLRIPLVVAGVEGVPAARLATPVSLIDVHDSILAWAQGESRASRASGLPVEPTTGARVVEGQFFDFAETRLADRSAVLTALLPLRRSCPPDARVQGHMRAVVRSPYKLVEYSEYPTQLFDLDRDPEETTDVAGDHPEIVQALGSHGARTWKTPPMAGDDIPEVSPELRERLRALGYGAE